MCIMYVTSFFNFTGYLFCCSLCTTLTCPSKVYVKRKIMLICYGQQVMQHVDVDTYVYVCELYVVCNRVGQARPYVPLFHQQPLATSSETIIIGRQVPRQILADIYGNRKTVIYCILSRRYVLNYVMLVFYGTRVGMSTPS